MEITGNFERFQKFNFETNFLNNANSFQKTAVPFFLVESTNIENATFPYKNVLSEANVKKNRMERTTYYQERMMFVSNYFIFSKMLFPFKNLV